MALAQDLTTLLLHNKKLFSASKKPTNQNQPQKTEKEKYICPSTTTSFWSVPYPTQLEWELTGQLSKVHRTTQAHRLPNSFFPLFPTKIYPPIHQVCFEELLILNAFPTFYDGKTGRADDRTESGFNFPTASPRRLKDNNWVLTLHKAFSIKMY